MNNNCTDNVVGHSYAKYYKVVQEPHLTIQEFEICEDDFFQEMFFSMMGGFDRMYLGTFFLVTQVIFVKCEYIYVDGV